MASRYQQARAFKTLQLKSGTSLTTTSTAWIDLATATNGPGAGGYDLGLAASVGDVLEAGINALWMNEAVNGRLDLATIVGGAIVNTFSGGTLAGTPGTTFGLSGWSGLVNAYFPIGGGAWYTVQAGDLSAGYVTVRPYVRVDAATLKTLGKSAGNPLLFAVKNLGQPDPN